MAFNIKNLQAEKALKELAATTGESLTEAATRALVERLERLRAEQDVVRRRRLRLMEDLIAEARQAPLLDPRPLKTITDELWGDE
jgi:antitoxin VapB